jgi:hypothetical protein
MPEPTWSLSLAYCASRMRASRGAQPSRRRLGLWSDVVRKQVAELLGHESAEFDSGQRARPPTAGERSASQAANRDVPIMAFGTKLSAQLQDCQAVVTYWCRGQALPA